ncbi:hypothetical protein MBM_04936 [Drepanopeziza brunnea f. sp. 'multigermtubi' MB_m1]|uniref:Ca2+-modulated nonselective cation channel polycystin n=1 Tax=Marssonina brunnea f. sp. multigermtubi (strain MB_m1) TaxID=1072389 RepID=K1WVG5_MARBU|nr:uncharacterized protein MBM_04936 [Drepanopeziza brunnea f. sp. 'multigermtubi' MB_m1]EKD16467.1 hypothetical protein MBM_04936 [Drepanopeziza brunnea f. sp. 'multigermtubi' MB_m1]
MATAETAAATSTAPTAPTPPQSPGTDSGRPGRRRPFSTWMKKLTGFKSGSSAAVVPASPSQPVSTKRNIKSASKKQKQKQAKAFSKNHPYPESGIAVGRNGGGPNGSCSLSTSPTGNSLSTSSVDRRRSPRSSLEGRNPPTIDSKSVAPTIMSTEQGAHSDAAPSHAASSGQGTNATLGCGVSYGRSPDSTFSSPAPSLRSLTTTLTTIQSATPNGVPASHNNPYHNSNNHNSLNANNTQSIHFSHQFPASPAPSAIPAHLAPSTSGGHPSTYHTATANNLLTDNASILTLASSSNRHRRRSMDTDASVRALAPSSMFGGSRESLPLSVLSSNIDASSGIPASSHQARTNVGAFNDRASIYSATGIAPALSSERNSYYAGKQANNTDGGSIKSGFLGHGRTGSVSGSIGGIAGSASPLASSPKEVSGLAPEKPSRRNSAWGEGGEGEKVEASDAEVTQTETEAGMATGTENGKA